MKKLRYLLATLALLVIGAPAYGQQVNLYCNTGVGIAPWAPCVSTNPLAVTIAGGTLVVTSDATATAAAPSYSEGTANPLSQTLTGNLRVTGVGGTFPVTGTFFQTTQPVSIASAQVASGAYASGALASGSIASGAMVDLVALSAPVAPATATATKSMLGGCQATSAGINPTTGQQAAIDCDLNNNILVSAGGAPNFATAQVSVTTGNISVCAARALRRSCMITNVTGTSAIYCGVTGVSTSTGDLLASTTGSNKVYNTTAAVFCTVASVTQTVTVAETY